MTAQQAFIERECRAVREVLQRIPGFDVTPQVIAAWCAILLADDDAVLQACVYEDALPIARTLCPGRQCEKEAS